MKLHELFESGQENWVSDNAKLIRETCGECLKAYQKSGFVLYRGMSKTGLVQIRQDRQPVEMRKDRHEALHKAFLDLGLAATRKNGIFCSANIDVASEWGDVKIIFLQDGWAGTVFREVRHGYAFDELAYAKPIDMKDIVNSLDPWSFDTAEGLAKVLHAGYDDIIMTGKNYLAYSVDAPTYELLEALEIDY